MKATIHNYDLIKNLNTPDGIEIGFIPKDVGVELMRWDGEALIDITSLNYIWVEQVGSGFRLHCIQVPYSQLVEMQYKDRKKLWNDAGIYKIKTDEQIQTELNLQYRRSHYPLVSDQMGALIKYIKTLPNLPIELQDIINKIDNVKDKYPKQVEVIK